MRLGVLVLAIAFGLPALAQKTDVLHFTNGDRLTCEIKRLRHGVLEVEVQAIEGTLRMDWRRISRIQSDKVFEFRLAGGEGHIGEIQKTEGADKTEGVSVLSGGAEIDLPLGRVIDVLPLNRNLGGSLDIEADGGFSFTRANEQVQYAANARVEHITPGFSIKGSVNSLFSGQTEAVNTNRHNFTGHYTKFIKARWSVHTLADFLISDQQQLSLRTTAGGGLGRDIRHTQRMFLGALGGVVWTNENYTEEANAEARNSVEAQMGLSFGVYSFKKINLRSDFWLFPSLSQGGRLRTDWRNSLKIDLPHDLYWRFGLTLNLDNDPPPGVPGNDVLTTTTLGWEF